MSYRDNEGCGAIVGALFIGLLVGGLITNWASKTVWRSEAVERGVAEWTVDKHGYSEWRWTVEPIKEPVAAEKEQGYGVESK